MLHKVGNAQPSRSLFPHGFWTYSALIQINNNTIGEHEVYVPQSSLKFRHVDAICR